MWRFTVALLQVSNYERRWLGRDVLAGIALAAHVVGGVMGYASVAGPRRSLGCRRRRGGVNRCRGGSSPQLSVGPVSTNALMAAVMIAPLAGADPRCAALAAALALVVGAFSVIGWSPVLGFWRTCCPSRRSSAAWLVWRVDDRRPAAFWATSQGSQVDTPLEWFLLIADANVDLDSTALDALEALRSDFERRGVVRHDPYEAEVARCAGALGHSRPCRRQVGFSWRFRLPSGQMRRRIETGRRHGQRMNRRESSSSRRNGWGCGLGSRAVASLWTSTTPGKLHTMAVNTGRSIG